MANIHGLDHFQSHFSDYKDHYVIVGGIASHLLLESVGVSFRATKDIDLVIVSDSQDFPKKLIEYVRNGEYEITEKKDQTPRFYRFKKPKKLEFSQQIEVFYRKPKGIDLFEGQHIVPIVSAHADIGISAILLNDEYFNLIKDNITTEGGVPITTTLATIVLKMKAFTELSHRKENGENIDSKEIKKHRSDVFRLSQGIIEGESIHLDGLPREDTLDFLSQVRSDKSVSASFQGLGLDISLSDSIDTLTSSLLGTGQ